MSESNNTTSEATAASAPQNNDTSRYEQLETLIAMGLQRARNNLNVEDLVDATYYKSNGDDNDDSNNILGGMEDCKEMLHTVVNDMLDKITLEAVFTNATQSSEIKVQLDDVDATIQTILRQEQDETKAEQDDQTSAREALANTLLPKQTAAADNNNLALKDVLAYHEYQRDLQEKARLTDQLAQLQKEIETLEKVHAQTQQDVQEDLTKLQSTAKELQQTANVCSTVVS